MNLCQRRNHAITLLGLTAALFGMACDGGDGAVEVSNVTPRSGHIQGQQPVTIEGSNFRTDIGYTVFFGTKAATRVSVQNPEQLLAITPGVDSPGSVDMMIRGDDGTAIRIVDGYRYEDMGGSVVEQLGESGEAQGDGNLAY
jgi:hypothetical protein